jgi:hypothetical protein
MQSHVLIFLRGPTYEYKQLIIYAAIVSDALSLYFPPPLFHTILSWGLEEICEERLARRMIFRLCSIH